MPTAKATLLTDNATTCGDIATGHSRFRLTRARTLVTDCGRRALWFYPASGGSCGHPDQASDPDPPCNESEHSDPRRTDDDELFNNPGSATGRR